MIEFVNKLCFVQFGVFYMFNALLHVLLISYNIN